jgi:hypothetical protein
MAAKKKAEKKHTKTKKPTSKKKPPMKKPAKKKPLKKKTAQKKAAVKTKAVGKKTINAKTKVALKKPVRRKAQTVNPAAFPSQRPGASSGGQSGDLQGLSRSRRADSESVEELLEEGNAFEADVVAGVEDAGNAEEKEVHTHEVPEDDVPGEYLDQDE